MIKNGYSRQDYLEQLIITITTATKWDIVIRG